MSHILLTRRKLVLLLRVFWVVILLYGEIGVFYKHIRQCKWPTKGHLDEEAVRVAIIADPQIVDHYSYDQTGLLLKVVEFFTDIYMRKSYIILQQQQQKPETVVFLGDLMDGGREWDDKAWLSEYQRFLLLFRNRNPSNTRVYYMAGNHDIGIGNTVVESALIRFHEYVGPTNQVLHIGGHEIVLLDTLTLESDSASVNSSSRSLVELLRMNNEQEHSKPRILFSHVPLWRPPDTPCGPLRQHPKPLLNRRGYQFRDQLFQNTTEYILEAIQPVAIFSGDDHDTCTVTHTIDSSGRAVPEYTIGAFGWASGVPIASYGLLTLYPASDANEPEFALQNCFLPYQLGIYKAYAWAFLTLDYFAFSKLHKRVMYNPPHIEAVSGSYIIEFEDDDIHRHSNNLNTMSSVSVHKKLKGFNGAIVAAAKHITPELIADSPGVKRVWPNPQAMQEFGLDGTGIKVCIIDSGVDYNHPELGACWKTEGCPWQLGYDFLGDEYRGEGTPLKPSDFPMDCLGHGTHVSGIIAGRGPQVHGVAPGATFGMYRVYSCPVNGSSYTDGSILMQAAEAAYNDGCNVINVSIGLIGWSEDAFGVYLSSLVEKGVNVVAAVGNDGANGIQTASAPAVSHNLISVGSVDNWNDTGNATTISTPAGERTVRISERGRNDVEFIFPPNTPVVLFEDDDGGYTGCNPTDADFTGSVVVVNRSDCPSETQGENVQSQGGIGMIVINNVPGFTVMGLTENTTIPAVTVRSEDGEFIINGLRQGDSTLVANFNITTTVGSPTAGLMSNFSSFGPSPELDLVPLISAPGANMWSTVPLNQGSYRSSSGTSLSSPYIAGCVALLRQRFPEMTSQQISHILVTSATPLIDQKNSLKVNPYHSGSGLVNIYNAVRSRVFIDPPYISINQTRWSQPSNIDSQGVRTISYSLNFTNTDVEKSVSVMLTHQPATSYTMYDQQGNYASSFLENEIMRIWPPDNRSVDQSTVPQAYLPNAIQYVRPGQTVNFVVGIILPFGLPESEHWFYGGFLNFTTLFDNETAIDYYVVPYGGYNGNYSAADMLAPASTGFPRFLDDEDNEIKDITSYKLGSSKMAKLAFILNTPTPYFYATVLDSDDNRINNNEERERVSRNLLFSTPNYTAFTVNVNVTNEEANSTEPNLSEGYRLLLAILRPFGNRENDDDYVFWKSDLFTLDDNT
ncbi:hypothetical protein IWW36_003160 [Coemansia brasiliensis]|uniref:Subtilisin n=1 Tax=Coemansia brasiliensis TaxID=2650707 RepID=A0A9W8I5R1_9FUNG|nr:hypothetical protein IWW36_003160 [Coemansia brasiliensis]